MARDSADGCEDDPVEVLRTARDMINVTKPDVDGGRTVDELLGIASDAIHAAAMELSAQRDRELQEARDDA